jgi:hypothetical protein
MKPPDFRITVRRLMIAMVFVAFYLATYRALVYRDLFHGSTRHQSQVVECYSYLPRSCSVLFEPANRLDRAIRPSYWSTPSSVF